MNEHDVTPGRKTSHRTEDHQDPATLTRYSNDRALNRLLQAVLEQVRDYAEDQISRIKRLTQIGISLSAEKSINRLLETIVDEARRFTNADGGTLYIVDPERTELRFAIMQCESMNVMMGGTGSDPIELPPIPLMKKDGRPNHANVSSYVALTGETANIPDVYAADRFDFTGPREYDARTGYRSKSMLVMPLKNHDNDIIGVLQLLNAMDQETESVHPFSGEQVDIIASLASQAAVALTNTQLLEDLRNLLYAFIKSIAAAIDDKSPYTGGHIRRVVDLTLMMARTINETKDGPLAGVSFDDDQLEELRMAAWMHDVGKITTPEHVVDKRTRLETVFDRLRLIETRFRLIEQSLRNDFLEKRLQWLERDADGPLPAPQLDDLNARVNALREQKEFIVRCNDPSEVMTAEKIGRLRAIAEQTFRVDGSELPYLTEEELYNLSIPNGNLTPEERAAIEHHATMTFNILKELPFPRKLSRVPKFAASHHEKPDGSGYPFGLKDDQLPIESRILAIADIFEALTAKDRPYKLPMKLSAAVRVLEFMKKDGHIDPDLFDLFLSRGLHRRYAEKELSPEQRDDA